MNRGVLAYGVLLGTAIAGAQAGLGGTEGEAIALGIASGVAFFIGYPLGRAVARLLIAGELRLLNSNLRRASELAAAHGIPLPSDEDVRGWKPSLSVWIAIAGIGVGAALAPVFAILAAMSAILAASALPFGIYAAFAAAVGGLGALGFALTAGITLFYRSRIEWAAFQLDVARGAGRLRERGRSVERALRIGSPAAPQMAD